MSTGGVAFRLAPWEGDGGGGVGCSVPGCWCERALALSDEDLHGLETSSLSLSLSAYPILAPPGVRRRMAPSRLRQSPIGCSELRFLRRAKKRAFAHLTTPSQHRPLVISTVPKHKIKTPDQLYFIKCASNEAKQLSLR